MFGTWLLPSYFHFWPDGVVLHFLFSAYYYMYLFAFTYVFKAFW
jgi:hypothetical protein